MKLDSVRDLKAEIGRRLAQTAPRPATPRRGFGLTTGPPPQRTVQSIALGVARGRVDGDYRLAVRLTRASPINTTLLEQLRKDANGEIDVRYVGRIAKSTEPDLVAWLRSMRRPLTIGASIGHSAVTAGTLGCFAVHLPTGRTVILSNNHVLADEDRAATGDAILQPGSFDAGLTPDHVVAELLSAEPLTRESNAVDAAVADLLPDVPFDPTLLAGLGALSGIRSASLEPGDRVGKLGRTTGLTRGSVTAIEVDGVEVEYDAGILVFDSQIEIEGSGPDAFSAGGDSGALIVDEAYLACGLLFAGGEHGGSNGKGLTYANDIHRVLAALDLELALGAPGV